MKPYEKDYSNKWVLLNSKIENGVQKNQVIEITKDEANEIEVHQENILEYQLIYRKYLTVRNNLIDIYRVIEEFQCKILKVKITKSMDTQKEAYIEINRVFINFVTSLKSFVEDFLLNNFLPKIYGKNSEQVKRFRAKTNELYDSELSYKFLMRIRDFAVHYELPIYYLEVGLTPKNMSDFPESVRIEPMFVKEHLFKNKTFKSKLINDLKSYNKKFPVRPILNSIRKILDEVIESILSLDNGKYKSSANKILEFEYRFKEPNEVWYGLVHADKPYNLTKLESENAKKINKY